MTIETLITNQIEEDAVWTQHSYYKGWSVAELRAMFARMHSPENWKLPFTAVIGRWEFCKAAIAAEFMTGGGIEACHLTWGTVTVHGKGYYHYCGA